VHQDRAALPPHDGREGLVSAELGFEEAVGRLRQTSLWREAEIQLKHRETIRAEVDGAGENG
jgi:hypothetical protein